MKQVQKKNTQTKISFFFFIFFIEEQNKRQQTTTSFSPPFFCENNQMAAAAEEEIDVFELEIDEDLIADYSHKLHPLGLQTLPPPASGRKLEEIEELDVTHNNLKSLEGIEAYPRLRKACFRQNLLPEHQPLGECRETLLSLDFYLNLMRSILPEGTAVGAKEYEYPRLLNFDASYNKVADLEGLQRWTTLRSLYLACNRIATLPPHVFQPLGNLRVLELGNNRLRSVGPGLEGLSQLKELFLGKNKLAEISGLASLTSLTRLDLQSNRITTIGEGLRNLTGLTELYFAHNGLEEIDDGFKTLTRLRCLDLSANLISRLQNLATLTELQDFWFSSNKLASFQDVEELKPAVGLQTVYFEHNPIQQDPQYRSRLGLILPSLSQIDAQAAYPSLSLLSKGVKLIGVVSQKTESPEH